ncbi:MAG: aminomethyltransferase beta-barrel domain-containing protein, partial [Nitrospiria bacterium]
NLIRQVQIEKNDPLVVTAKVRYRSAEAGALVKRLDEDRLEIVFDQPQRAVTPGQSVVMYQGEDVLGGGIIESVNA